ncbi:unnamed protein product [Diamesa serratosioi]
MFLNKLVAVARSPGSICQLSNVLKKLTITTSATQCSKLEIQKPDSKLLSIETHKNPVTKINEELNKNQQGRLFAVVHLCGKQFKVTAGDVILVEGYWPPNNGDNIRLDKVLIAGAEDFSLIGRPTLQKGLVDVQATIIEKSLSHTRTHFKKKRRKQFQRINFYRSPTTMIRINSIEITNNLDEKPSTHNELEIY